MNHEEAIGRLRALREEAGALPGYTIAIARKGTRAMSDVYQAFDRHIYRVLLGLAASALGIGTVVYRLVEHMSWLDAYYLSVVTLTTVGYGDFSPQTTFGKVFTTFYIFSGVGILTSPASAF
jgi:hypothetical protein